MVKPLGNVKFVCKQCGWSKAMHFDSDVIFGEPESCPKCGNKEFWLESCDKWGGIFCKLTKKR